jgi:hypothetical protein
MSERDKLLQEIDRFVARTGVPESRLGMEAVGNPSFVTRLRRGKRIWLDTADKVRTYMREYRPPKPRPRRAADRAAA